MVIVQTSGVCHPSDSFNYCPDTKLQYRNSVNRSARFSLSVSVSPLTICVCYLTVGFGVDDRQLVVSGVKKVSPLFNRGTQPASCSVGTAFCAGGRAPGT